MASLEKCADALLQQKALQGMSHEHLEHRVLELERIRRTACVGLRGLLCATQRRARDLADVAEAGRACDAQLAQDRLKLGALAMAAAADRKSRESTAHELTAVADAWAGQPTRIVQLVRALQERAVVCKGAAGMAATLRAARGLVTCVLDRQRLRAWADSRLHCQRTHFSECQSSIRLNAAATRNTIAEHRQTAAALREETHSLWACGAEQARELVLLEATKGTASIAVEAAVERSELARTAVTAACERLDQQTLCLTQLQEQHCLSGKRVALSDAQLIRIEGLREQQRVDAAAVRKANEAACSQAVTAVAAHTASGAALTDTTKNVTAAAQHLLSCLRAAAALIAAKHKRIKEHNDESARRSAESEAASATLSILRARHTAHVLELRAARMAERRREAIIALTAEEVLTRRRELVGREAAAFQFLCERARLAFTEVATVAALATRTVVAKRANVSADAEAEAAATGRKRRTYTKRLRHTAGSCVSTTRGGGGGTLAEALGLDNNGTTPRHNVRRTHPTDGTRRSSVGAAAACHTPALFTAPQKDRSGGTGRGALLKRTRGEWPCHQRNAPSRVSTVAAGGGGGDAGGGSAAPQAWSVSGASSPPPRPPSALPTAASAAGRPRPLPRLLVPRQPQFNKNGNSCGCGSSVGSALASAVSVGGGPPSQQTQQRPAALPVGDRWPLARPTRGTSGAAAAVMALRPTAVRTTTRATLLMDSGEDLFADIFS